MTIYDQNCWTGLARDGKDNLTKREGRAQLKYMREEGTMRHWWTERNDMDLNKPKQEVS